MKKFYIIKSSDGSYWDGFDSFRGPLFARFYKDKKSLINDMKRLKLTEWKYYTYHWLEIIEIYR